MRDQAELIDDTGHGPRAAWPGVRPEHRAEDQPGPQQRPPDYGPGDKLWTVSGVSHYLQVPVSAVYKMTAKKAPVRIPHIRLGGKLRFRKLEIDRWLTLLTVSNIETLERMRRKVSKVIHGNDTQTTAPQR